MSKEAPQWEQAEEAEKQIAKLIENYPDKFGHIDPKQIACVQITNLERPKGCKWNAKIEGVKAPVSLFCEKRYVIHFYMQAWEEFTSAQRAYVLTNLIKRIPQSEAGEPDGSLLAEDLKGDYELTKAFGVDAMDDPHLPDLSKDKQLF